MEDARGEHVSSAANDCFWRSVAPPSSVRVTQGSRRRTGGASRNNLTGHAPQRMCHCAFLYLDFMMGIPILCRYYAHSHSHISTCYAVTCA